jgi:hypothetical protein
VRNNTSIDWTIKETVKAKLKVAINSSFDKILLLTKSHYFK